MERETEILLARIGPNPPCQCEVECCEGEGQISIFIDRKMNLTIYWKIACRERLTAIPFVPGDPDSLAILDNRILEARKKIETILVSRAFRLLSGE